jgi:hypothetical protein
MKLGINAKWPITVLTACSILNCLLQWQLWDVSKLHKITILHCHFPTKHWFSKCCIFPMDWDRVKAFQLDDALPYDRHVIIFSISQVQNFLSDKGGFCPLQTPNIRGHTPLLATPDVSFG